MNNFSQICNKNQKKLTFVIVIMLLLYAVVTGDYNGIIVIMHHYCFVINLYFFCNMVYTNHPQLKRHTRITPV